jgi:hypothetical protein
MRCKLWYLQNCLQYILVKFHPLHHSPLSLLPSSVRIVLTGLIFPFSYLSTKYFHRICTATSFAYILLSHWYLTSNSTFYLPVFHFFKKRHLCKITIQKGSLWHFHICIVSQNGSSPQFFSFLQVLTCFFLFIHLREFSKLSFGLLFDLFVILACVV